MTEFPKSYIQCIEDALDKPTFYEDHGLHFDTFIGLGQFVSALPIFKTNYVAISTNKELYGLLCYAGQFLLTEDAIDDSWYEKDDLVRHPLGFTISRHNITLNSVSYYGRFLDASFTTIVKAQMFVHNLIRILQLGTKWTYNNTAEILNFQVSPDKVVTYGTHDPYPIIVGMHRSFM